MNKQDLIEAIAQKASLDKKEVGKSLDGFIQVIQETLRAGAEVGISGFGVFTVSHRAARMGVNPQNPAQKIQIPAVKVPKFRAGKGLKDAVR